MADLRGTVGEFNAEDHAAPGVLPAGDYTAAVTNSELLDTKNGNGGKRLNLTWQIVEGPMKDRQIFHGINIKNPNPEAERIGLAELAMIARAAGKPNLRDSSELHNLPMLIRVAIVKRKDTGDDKNEIKKVTSRTAPQAKEATAGGKAPW